MQSMKVPGTLLGLAAAGALLALTVVPLNHAQAASLINPGAAQSVQDVSKPVTEVGWHRGWHHHRHWHRWHHRHW